MGGFQPVLSEQLQTANLSSTWPEGNSIQDWSRRQTMLSFQTVAKLIASREARKVERDFFYVELRGFDTHNDVREVMEELFDNLNFALEYFVAELKAQGIFDATTLVTSSDFGRTLTSNGRAPTWLGWELRGPRWCSEGRPGLQSIPFQLDRR